jgi:hypothetical protein
MTNSDDAPEFDSLDEMAEVCGFDAETRERMRIDMMLTEPREQSDTLH